MKNKHISNRWSRTWTLHI